MRAFIGVDPHKLSATIEVIDDHETVLTTGRFGTDKSGYAAMRRHVAAWPERTWAVEGSNGAGHPLAQRLLADGEHVVDVPAKLAARARLFDTGHNRKTDAHDAHAVAVVAVRTEGLRVLSYDVELEALRMLADRREELTRQRVQTVNRLQRQLSELTPGRAKKDITALQAKGILASVRPRDLAGKTRRRLAVEQLTELVAVEKKIKALTKELNTMVHARGSTLMDLPGVGPVVAARILADVGDVARFADRNRFASWTGTAPLDASSGEQIRHRLSRAGNRKMNHMLHIAAATQARLDTEGRVYYRRKLTEGKTRMEAMRCLKRRISDAVYRQLLTDAVEVSAYPDRYATFEPVAEMIIEALTGGRERGDDDRTPVPETSNVVLPLPAGVGVKTSGFGIRVHPITGETKLHTGIDYSAPTGTPILATADGRVYFAGASAGYGHIILIDHTVNGQRVSSGYAHMFGERIYVRAGDQVTAGQHIADIGMFGYTTGPHLHFEIRPGGGWSAPVDPEPWLATHGGATLRGATTTASGCAA